MAKADKATLGFIGLGSMGLPMALNLAEAGFDVAGFDVAAGRIEALEAKGGRGAASPRKAAEGQDLLLVVVANAMQVEAALMGDEGAVSALAPGSTVVVHSTVAPSFMRDLGGRLEALGHCLLDAPISGGVAGAEAGTLTVMASGTESAFAAAEKALEAVAGKVYRLGDAPGVGSTVKMINQHLAGIHIAAAAEAVALGTAAGADARTLFEVISNSAGSSWMFANRVPHILERDFSPRSAVEIFVKDLGIVLESARELRFPLPMAATAHQQYLAAAAAGFGYEDDSAVVKVYERLAGIQVGGEGGGKKS